MKKRPGIIEFISLALLSLVFFSLTLAVYPLTDSIILYAKLFSLLFAGVTSIALFGLALIQNKKVQFISSPLILPLILIGLAATISSLLTNAYPVENLLGFGGAIIAGVLFTLFIAPILPRKIAYVQIMGVSAALLGVLTALQAVGRGPSEWLNQAFAFKIPNDLAFNLAGSSLIALEITFIVLVIIIAKIRVNKHLDKTSIVLLPILLLASGLYVWTMLPGKPAQPRLPSWSGSWSIMLDSIRAPRSALIGLGTQNYSNAYAMYKPTWLNKGDNWTTIYNQASNTPFTIATTMGFLGLIAWTILTVKIYKEARKASPSSAPLAWGLLATIVIQLILPPSLVMIGIQFILLTMFIAQEKHRYSTIEFRTMAIEMVRQAGGIETTPKPKSQHASAYLIGGLLIVVAGAGFYFTGRALSAYQKMHQATKKGLENKVVEAYQLEQEAIALNPYLDEFRRRYALTNMSIAIALSNNADATEEDKQQVAQLVQQATREAKAATALDQDDWQNWFVLAQIYQNLITVSKDALQWSIQSYVDAANRFPSNPNIRLALGNVFMDQKNYTQAANIFNQAVNLKPDFANSHYQLAVALKNANQLDQAKQAYQETLKLLKPDSDDFVTVTQELEKLESEIKDNSKKSETSNSSEKQSLTEQNLKEPGENPVSNTGQDVDLNSNQEKTNQQAQPEAQTGASTTPPTTPGETAPNQN